MPIPQNRFRRNAQHCRDFIRFETAEKLQFHHLTFAGIGDGETLERVVQFNKVRPALAREFPRFIEIKFFQFSAALLGVVSASVLDKNAPHQMRGDAGKVRPVFPICPALIDQLQISFVHQRGRLQRVVGSLMS